MPKVQDDIITMPYAEVGTETSTEYEMSTRITDAEILQGKVEKVDNYTIKITTVVKPTSYNTDLLVRTTSGLHSFTVKTRT